MVNGKWSMRASVIHYINFVSIPLSTLKTENIVFSGFIPKKKKKNFIAKKDSNKM